MKIEKNKIVFGSVLAVVVIFIVAYSMMVFGGDGEESQDLKQTLVPDLKQEQEDFKSKMDAVNALKEVRETNAPSIYDERLLDSLGFYDPELRNKQKMRIVDSIYKQGRINYSENSYRNIPAERETEPEKIELQKSVIAQNLTEKISAKELGLEHQLFYSSAPSEGDHFNKNSEVIIPVEVDGNQVVKAGYRLRMRTTEEVLMGEMKIPENTQVYGFISFKPNRALINIVNINHQPVKLKAYDLQDGSEGIYVENSIRAEVGREIIDDIIQDIDIPGVPQVGGIQRVFQRNNRNIKVTITNNYKLILK